jgi:hypothetical protein
MKILLIIIILTLHSKVNSWIVCDDNISACGDDYICCIKLTGKYSCCIDSQICCKFGTMCCDKNNLFKSYNIESSESTNIKKHCEDKINSFILHNYNKISNQDKFNLAIMNKYPECLEFIKNKFDIQKDNNLIYDNQELLGYFE